MYVLSDVCFFFQAEDGIRDAQESRGLGDVYKRQMQQEKAVGVMAEIKPLDSFKRHVEKLRIGRNMLGIGICPVGQQGKIQLSIRVRQVVDFKPVYQLLDIVSRNQEGGHDNQCPELGWHTFTQRKAWNDSGIHEAGDCEIDNRNTGVRCWE